MLLLGKMHLLLTNIGSLTNLSVSYKNIVKKFEIISKKFEQLFLAIMTEIYSIA